MYKNVYVKRWISIYNFIHSNTALVLTAFRLKIIIVESGQTTVHAHDKKPNQKHGIGKMRWNSEVDYFNLRC